MGCGHMTKCKSEQSNYTSIYDQILSYGTLFAEIHPMDRKADAGISSK